MSKRSLFGRCDNLTVLYSKNCFMNENLIDVKSINRETELSCQSLF